MAETPWHLAELDDSNSELYVVELAGGPVEWEFRDHPDYYDEDGKPRIGDEQRVINGVLYPRGEGAPKLVRPAYARVELRARSKDEAVSAALATHPGFNKGTVSKPRG